MLQVSQLGFSYGQRPLFTNLSFSLLPGQLLQIKGSNGVGKSTFLSLLAGLQTPRSGSFCFWDGAKKESLRFHSEYLGAESNNLFLKLSAQQNLSYWLSLKKTVLSQDHMADTLAFWGLGERFVSQHLPVEKFSTGMKRRLALARLTASNTKVWLIDEPLFGLDERAAHLFGSVLVQHLAKGGMAVLVSHEPVKLEGIAIENHRHLVLESV